MSHEKSMSERLPEVLFSSIHQALGAASMCWIPQPGEQVFDSTRAADIGLELCRDVADWHEKDIATLTAERDQLIEELAGCHCGRSMVHKSCVAARDKLLEDIKERDRTYLAVQQADGLEREKVEAERDALRSALQALVDEQNGPPLLKDSEYWEAAMNQAGEALGVIRTPIPPSVFSSEQARKEIEKRHIEPLTPETHSHGKAEPEFGGDV